jgi:hypothetical protein
MHDFSAHVPGAMLLWLKYMNIRALEDFQPKIILNEWEVDQWHNFFRLKTRWP